MAITLALATPARAEHRGGLLFTTGLAQKSDAVVAGAGGAWRWRFLGVDLAAQVGLGIDFWIVRPSLHAIAEARFFDFEVHALGGPSILAYRTRGAYAEFCEKAKLECDQVEWGFDVGLGLGWSFLSLEAYLGTGELPLATVVGKATWLF